MKLESERGVLVSHSETEKLFINLRRAQWHIVTDDISGCAWMSDTISRAIAYMALMENEILQLKMENEILKTKDEVDE